MPAKSYSYQGRAQGGGRVKGAFEADSEEAVAAHLADQGIVALSIDPAGRGLNREITVAGFGRTKPTAKDLVVFSRQFATMIGSGLSLVRSLGILEDQTERPGLKKALGELGDDIKAGSSLSAAMLGRSDVFPPIMIHMIRAGETGGFLDGALDRVATVLEADEKLRSKVRGAMVYPLVVLGLMVVIVTGMLLFIVPIFQKMFDDLGGQLPVPTQVLVVAGQNIWWGLPLLVLLVVGGVALYRQRMKDPAFRLRVDALKLKVPVFGQLNKKVAMSRFSRNLGLLLGSGVPILQALEVVSETIGNAKVAQVLAEARFAVSEGRALSAPMLDAPDIFPSMVSHMLQVGEDTGQVEHMLTKVAQFYDLEVETTTDALASLLEPLLIVVLGVVIGAMVVALYLPMFTIYDQIR
jgi:type IV pilus assembly protein PilC